MVPLERREGELLSMECCALVSLSAFIVFLSVTLLGQRSGQRLHNIAIVVLEQ